eukprot:gene15623-5705_t
MVHVEGSRQIFGLACLLFAELVGGADWSNCGSGDDVVMHFPDPHGKGFPTKYSLTDWGGDRTDSLVWGLGIDLNGMVFSGRKPYIDGLDGSSTVALWNGYPQYYSTKQIPGTDAWFALRRSTNGHLLLQRTDRHTTEANLYSYVGINLLKSTSSTTKLPSGKAGKTWKYSPGEPALNDLPSSQFNVTIRLDCCKATTKVTWGTPGPWSDAPGLGSKCGQDANGFPNGVRERSVQCGGQSDCQTCAYTDETDTKPATRDFNFYACTTVAPTPSTPCPNVPHTITAKTKISCSAQWTQYKIDRAVCGATPPCQCDGNNQGSTILDQTKPCCNWQSSLGTTLPGSKCGQQPKARVTYTCPFAVPVVLLLLAASLAGIAVVIRRKQNGNMPLPVQDNNANVITNQTFDNTAAPMARTGSVVVLGNNRQRYLVPMEPERVRPAPSADGGSDSDYVPPSAAQARAYDRNPLLGAYDRSVQLAVYEEVDEDAGSSTAAAPPTAQLGADGYMDDSSVNQPQEIEYAAAAPSALSDTADYSVSAALPSTAVYSPTVGSAEVALAAVSSHV